MMVVIRVGGVMMVAVMMVVLVIVVVVVVGILGVLEDKHHWFAVFTKFHGINTPTMVYFELPL